MLTIYVYLQVPLPPPSSSLFSGPLQQGQGPITNTATAAEAAALNPGPPVYELAKARTVLEAWREYKTGIGGGPTEELETLWQARWRPLQRQRTAWCRRKVIIDEVLRLTESGLAPDDAVAELEARRNKRSLQVLHDELKAQQLSEALRAQLLST